LVCLFLLMNISRNEAVNTGILALAGLVIYVFVNTPVQTGRQLLNNGK